MKKAAAILLALGLTLGLAACAAGENENESLGMSPETKEMTNVAALSGPTGMGMAYLNEWSENGETEYEYNIQYAGSPDELTGGLISGEIQIAAVPLNLAGVLFNKTKGEVLIARVNTLGVLYIVEKGETINSLKDLEGKKLTASGKGSIPEYALSYLLEENGLTGKVNIEYASEHDEVITALAGGLTDVAMLPEPKVTAALMQVEGTRIAVDLTKEWEKLNETELVQGVIVIRKDFADEHPEIAKAFLEEYEKSVESVNARPEEAAELIEKYGILPKAAIALKALPDCNIVCLSGREMKDSVNGMLKVLYDANPASVGGSLPGNEIFFEAE